VVFTLDVLGFGVGTKPALNPHKVGN